MMTWALSLVPIMAMSVRILFTSHDRCWSVGSLPYLLCHLDSDLRVSEHHRHSFTEWPNGKSAPFFLQAPRRAQYPLRALRGTAG